MTYLNFDVPKDTPDFDMFDGFEVHPCEYVDDEGAVEPITDEKDIPNTDMWSVYGHLKTGGVDCLCDVPTLELAKAVVFYWSSLSGLHNVYSPMVDLDLPIGVDLLDHDNIGSMSHDNGSDEIESRHSIEMAEQQLLGYKMYREGGIIDLAESMGLTEDEFNTIVEDYPFTIQDNDLRELQQWFDEKRPTPVKLERWQPAMNNVLRVHGLDNWLKLCLGAGVTMFTSDKIHWELRNKADEIIGMFEDCGADVDSVGYICSSAKAYKMWSEDTESDETAWVEVSTDYVSKLTFVNQLAFTEITNG